MSVVDRTCDWLKCLVQIPSVTPMQAGPRAGIPGEARIAKYVATSFAQLGGEVVTDTVLPERENVYGIWRGTSERWIAVDIHSDTVGVEDMEGEPFSGDSRDGRIWGRGAVDTKATLAVLLAILEDYAQRGRQLVPNLIVAATVDEEIGATGAPAFARWMQRHNVPVQQIVVGEPTMCTPIFGHKGLVRCLLTTHGQAAHSSEPEKGKNALIEAVHIAVALEAEHISLQNNTGSLLGPPKLTVSTINGGSGINVVPERCVLGFDRRVVETESASEVVAQLVQLAKDASSLPVTVEILKEIDAYLQAPDSPWLQQLEEWTGAHAQTAPYGTNAWAYRDLPCECVVLGPGSVEQAHRAQEWVAIEQLEKIEQIFRKWFESNSNSPDTT